MKNIATITCPECGHKQKMEIPDGKCIPFYRCMGCKRLISAEKSCCVFCEFADKKCPVNHS